MVPESRRSTLDPDQWPLPPFSPIWQRALEADPNRESEKAAMIADLNRRIEARKAAKK